MEESLKGREKDQEQCLCPLLFGKQRTMEWSGESAESSNISQSVFFTLMHEHSGWLHGGHLSSLLIILSLYVRGSILASSPYPLRANSTTVFTGEIL